MPWDASSVRCPINRCTVSGRNVISGLPVRESYFMRNFRMLPNRPHPTSLAFFRRSVLHGVSAEPSRTPIRWSIRNQDCSHSRCTATPPRRMKLLTVQFLRSHRATIRRYCKFWKRFVPLRNGILTGAILWFACRRCRCWYVSMAMKCCCLMATVGILDLRRILILSRS